MAQNLVFTEAARLLDAMFLKATYTPPTSPVVVALASTIGTQSTAGTEISGGGYARAALGPTNMGAASTTAGTNASIGDLVYSNMPDTTAASIKAIDIYDSAGTPRRMMTGSLTTPKTTAAGDTLTIKSGQLTAGLAA